MNRPLRARVLTALVIGIPAVVAIVFLPFGVVAFLLSLVLAAAVREYARLVAPGFLRLYAGGLTVLVISSVWFLVALQNPIWVARIEAIGLAWWVLAALWLSAKSEQQTPTVRSKGLAGLFVFLPAALAVIEVQRVGALWLLSLLVIVWAADIGAYFVGKRFGVRKLAPDISPSKTWAGAFGGIGCGGLVALALAYLHGLDQEQSSLFLLLGLVTVAASILGDLFESHLKRLAHCKDSGSMLPGHGGVLDRVDSLLAAAPVFGLGVYAMGLSASY